MKSWRAIVLVALVIPGLLLASAAVSSGVGSKGCGLAAPGQIRESEDFTPFASRRGGPLGDHRINPAGAVFVRSANHADLPDAVGGLGLAFVIRASTATYAYYFDGPVDDKLTAEAFHAAGGLEYSVEAADGGGSFPEWLLSNVGSRAVAVDVGSNAGVLTWADPDVNGLRTHNLYWFDGAINYSLIGHRGPDELLNAARAVVCG